MRIIAAMLLLAASLSAAAADRDAERLVMVRTQIEARGIRDARVLDAMRAVERHRFVPDDVKGQAYEDRPLPIGEGQTISQPYIVALMTELLRLKGAERVLEVGTGSGYQAAILARVAREVYTIEIKPLLHERAVRLLSGLALRNVTAVAGDGYYGIPSAAPFDAIMITAAVDHVPPPLLAQLVDGGRLVLPLGHPFAYQDLVVVTRKGSTYTVDHVLPVSFVPMTGAALE
ncbi:MAG: protein-L-isoaspartate(D-aspartate) O-methyltransferase [Spirochaetes bacterium]|nr:protein-L-isoaspartate(D-aspartate) O-methyltransferase [Spirochaetota bacterium]